LREVDPDARMIRKLSRSPYLLVVADSILANIDREALAELLASYLYFTSKGRADVSGFVTYAVEEISGVRSHRGEGDSGGARRDSR
jgi:hypothetical protein